MRQIVLFPKPVYIAMTVILEVAHSYGKAPELPWEADPEVVASLMSRFSGANFDESRVHEYVLPNPLSSSQGEQVQTAAVWYTQRRGELLESFREHVYGRRPDVPYQVDFKVLSEQGNLFNGLAVGRTVRAIITCSQRSFSFDFAVVLPATRSGAVPAVVFINNRGPLLIDDMSPADNQFWPASLLIRRGYATASFRTIDVDPDRSDGYAEGIRGFFADGKTPSDNAWGSLSAWGWGASRVLDYLAICPEVDSDFVAIAGHSRGGKSALWAACEDTRFAIAYSNDSGCGGAALSRRAYGETVDAITRRFPHWFCRNFARYAGRDSSLPVDQHEVIALIAPRCVYVASADEDLWADPRGEYLALFAAAPVFDLLGKKGISDATMPCIGIQRIVGQTGYHIRRGGHGLNEFDWQRFSDFVDHCRTSDD